MSQGWSNISISIKSDMLAELLAKHGIVPKGAGNVKNGIRYDVDFEWDYTSRYEYMAQEITSIGSLILYYISCVLAMENGRELTELEKDYVHNMDAIDKSVECAYYDAVVWWDVNPKEKAYSFKLEPDVKKVPKGAKVLSDPQNIPASFDNTFSLLGEFDDPGRLVQLLEARGWEYADRSIRVLNEDWIAFEIQQHKDFGMVHLRCSRFIVIGDKTYEEISRGLHNRLVSNLKQLQKINGCVLISQQRFLALGEYVRPALDFSAITSIQGKNFLLDGIEDRKLSNQIRRDIKAYGGEVKTSYSNKVDVLIYNSLWTQRRDAIRAACRYDKDQSVILLHPEEFFEMLSFLAPVEAVPAQPVSGALAGMTCVLVNYEGKPKDLAAIKKLITDNGGVIRKSVSGKTDFVIGKHWGMQTWTEWRTVDGVYTQITHENEPANIRDAKILQEEGAKVELILEEDFLGKFGLS